MSGKYDPPDKTRLLAENPSISSTCELMVAAAEAQFPPKAKRDDSASRACVGENSNSQPRKRGRKPVVTPERIEMICELLANLCGSIRMVKISDRRRSGSEGDFET
jgi:hypothetical protein